MGDPDISDYLELDMDMVWAEIADVNGDLEGPEGRLIGRVRDEHGMIERSFLDIGIVRLPDIDKPHVKVRHFMSSPRHYSDACVLTSPKVFRVKLTVWSQASKTLVLRSGIRGGKSGLGPPLSRCINLYGIQRLGHASMVLAKST
jgi:hypothetical protein